MAPRAGTPRPTGGGRQGEGVLDLLAGHRILGRLPAAELAALVRQASVRAYAERAVIFRQGDAGHGVLAVVDGYVKLSAAAPSGREVVLEVAGPGAVFGELAVLNNWPRAAEAEALSACRLLNIDAAAFIAALTRHPQAMLEVVRLLSERLRTVTEQMTDAVDLPATARLAKALLRLAALHSHKVEDGLRIDLMLSQRELGGMTGLTRESINKHLAGWRDQGWLHLVEGAIVLVRPTALREIVREHSLD
jgi:CRP-like cAMP-binding protein